MNPFVMVARWIVRIAGLVQIVTGLLFWTGNALGLVPLHMLSGLVLVLALWVLAILAGRAGAGWGLATGAILWGAFVLIFGMAHGGLLRDGPHWVIQVLHLLAGLAAMGLGERLVTRMRLGVVDGQAARSPTTA